MTKRKKSFASPFVPVEEQPYLIPENWCWVKLQFVCEYLKAGGDKPGSFVEEKDEEHPFPVVANGIESDGIIGFTNIGPISAGTVSVSGRGTIGYSILREYEYMPVVRLIVIKPQENLLPLYLKFVFDVLEEKGTGSSIPQLTIPMIKDKFIPLPPLAEQHRIVNRIESLFTKLDEAKEKARAVVDGFELRKSAILHKAFTGELTERWRKEHGVGLDSWTDTTIGEQAELITKGASPRWQGVEYTDDKSQTLFVTSENVREGYLDLTKEKYLSSKINDIQKRSVLNYGDVLVNIVGASIGRAAIYNLHQLANTNQAVCIVRLKPGISNEFVCSYLNAPIAQSYYYDNKVETARANVSLGSISAMHINMPTSSEQEKIVDILNKVLEAEQQSKSAAEAVLDQIDTMKKAILARAFRGELGTNDPAEESAEDVIRAVIN